MDPNRGNSAVLLRPTPWTGETAEIACSPTSTQHVGPLRSSIRGQQIRRQDFTSEFPAAVTDEWNKQSPRPVGGGPCNGKVEETRRGKTATAEEYIRPSDSVSIANGETADGYGIMGGILSAGDWARRAMQLFPSERDFRHAIKSWVVTVHPSAPFDDAGYETWLNFDAERDSVTAGLLPPPQAPEIRRDASSPKDERLELLRSEQTADSVCLGHNVFAQTCGIEPDEPSEPETAAEMGHKTASFKTPQPTDAAKPGKPADVLQKDEPAGSLEPAEPKHNPEPNRLAAGVLPLPSMTIHILLAEEKHVEGMRDVYNEEVSKGKQARDREPVSSASIRRLYEASQESKLPLLVALSDDKEGGQVLGVALLQPRLSQGFDRRQEPSCTECSIFVRFKYRNRGIGQELLHRLLTTVRPSKSFELPQPQVHYIYIEIVCGSEDGLLEKKYIDTLTRKFNFEYYGRPVDVVQWSDKGPGTAKRLLFYHRCIPPGADIQDGPGRFTEMPIDGQAQLPRIRPETQPVDPAGVTVPGQGQGQGHNQEQNQSQDQGQGPKSKWQGRLLYDLVTAPATDTNNSRGQVSKAPTQEFW